MSILPQQLLGRLRERHGDDIGVCEHTDDIVANDIFIAYDNAVDYIPAALEKGALAVVCSKDMPEVSGLSRPDDIIIEVEDIRQFSFSLVEAVYGDDIARVSLAGITGTNGKTSTAHFACQLFELLGERAGYIGTLGYGVVSEGLHFSRNTTPDVVTLYRYIALLSRHGCSRVVMEVSSHALALDRIRGLGFELGLFTNLSRDHLDFHGSMDAYEEAKLSFFRDYAVAKWIVNTDYPAGEKLLDLYPSSGAHRLASFGQSSRDRENYFCYHIAGKEEHGSALLEIAGDQGSERMVASVQGRFNLENLVSSVLLCHVAGYPLRDVVKAAVSVKAVPGRMECVEDSRGIRVCVDYAHTPAGIEAVMDDHILNDDNRGKIWCVFGCGGDRDRGKRPMMGRVVADHSDRIIVTDDNVRGDQAEEILCDVLAGIEDKSGVIVCRDRSKAIDCVLDTAIRNDMVLLLGKGNESSIAYGNHKLLHRDMDAVMQHVRQP